MAERSPRVLRAAAACAMEIAWIYAAVAFVFEVSGLALYPLWGAALILTSGFAVTRAVSGRGWRVVGVWAAQLAVFALGASAAVHAFGRWTEPGLRWVDPRWLRGFARISGIDEWATLFLVLACSAAFWAGGVRLARRPSTGLALTARFDIGVGAFSAILFLGWAVGESTLTVRRLLPWYFVFAALSLAMARLAGGRRSWSGGFAELGVALSFCVPAVLLAAAVIPLLPLLEEAARAGYSVMLVAARAASPWLLALLRFLFGFWTPRTAETAGPPRPDADLVLRALENEGRSGLGLTITMWAMGLLAGALVLATAGWGLWRLLRFLLSRTPRSRPPHRFRWLWLEALASALRRLLGPAIPAGAGVKAFARLDVWARRSGAGRHPGETPHELGRRLRRLFPAAAADVDSIVAGLARELYGGRRLERPEVDELRRAGRRLGSPRHRPSRLRRRLRHD